MTFSYGPHHGVIENWLGNDRGTLWNELAHLFLDPYEDRTLSEHDMRQICLQGTLLGCLAIIAHENERKGIYYEGFLEAFINLDQPNHRYELEIAVEEIKYGPYAFDALLDDFFELYYDEPEFCERFIKKLKRLAGVELSEGARHYLQSAEERVV